MTDLVELFCNIDDFLQSYRLEQPAPKLAAGPAHRNRPGQLNVSELMTLMVLFHQSRFRNFKHFYLAYVLQQLRPAFPGLVSYGRLVELMPRTLIPLSAYLQHRYGTVSGISFIDSAKLSVCHNRRIGRHKVFKELAQRGKTSVGWFYGFKLHLVVNEQGELLAVMITPGNTDDRTPVPQLSQRLWGKLFGDKGYISQALFEQLYAQGVELITKIKRRMQNRLMPVMDKLVLRKRSIIETIIDQLKNISQIEHTRHRSALNFLVNVVAGLVAYTHQPKKPSLDLTPKELATLPCLL